MKTILFMHGGSGNHGCEAIVRTTSELLGGPKDVVLWSQNREEDIQYGAAECVERVVQAEEIRRFSPSYFEAQFLRRIRKNEGANLQIFLRDLFKGNTAVSIGGDNYCYPWSARQAVELDREIRKHCAHSVLWGCSIDREAITPEVREDLSRFDLITAREQISYETLKEINPNTVKVADPAFLLEKEELPLPDGFAENNTVGVNISPLIMDYSREKSLILDNYRELIRYILSETDMNICLIPHVVWEYNDDRRPIRALYEEFSSSGRISMIDDGSCRQLKGFIARCRFFVGARTHATIAAYSSLVPTLVVGYSVKSRGIARDLFGTDEGYVVPVQGLRSETELVRRFSWLAETEKEQRRILSERMPEYRKEAASARLFFDQMTGK